MTREEQGRVKQGEQGAMRAFPTNRARKEWGRDKQGWQGKITRVCQAKGTRKVRGRVEQRRQGKNKGMSGENAKNLLRHYNRKLVCFCTTVWHWLQSSRLTGLRPSHMNTIRRVLWCFKKFRWTHCLHPQELSANSVSTPGFSTQPYIPVRVEFYNSLSWTRSTLNFCLLRDGTLSLYQNRGWTLDLSLTGSNSCQLFLTGLDSGLLIFNSIERRHFVFNGIKLWPTGFNVFELCLSIWNEIDFWPSVFNSCKLWSFIPNWLELWLYIIVKCSTGIS